MGGPRAGWHRPQEAKVAREEGRKVEVPNVDTCMQFWHFEMDINDATLFEGRNLSHFIVTSFSLVLWLSFVSMFTM